MSRATYLSVVQYHNLEHACRLFTHSFGFSLYLVGSVLVRKDYRDVDLRCILDNNEFDLLTGRKRIRLKLLNTAFSEWLQARTGLLIDFQFQSQKINDKYYHKHRKNFIGMPIESSEKYPVE